MWCWKQATWIAVHISSLQPIWEGHGALTRRGALLPFLATTYGRSRFDDWLGAMWAMKSFGPWALSKHVPRGARQSRAVEAFLQCRCRQTWWGKATIGQLVCRESKLHVVVGIFTTCTAHLETLRRPVACAGFLRSRVALLYFPEMGQGLMGPSREANLRDTSLWRSLGTTQWGTGEGS